MVRNIKLIRSHADNTSFDFWLLMLHSIIISVLLPKLANDTKLLDNLCEFVFSMNIFDDNKSKTEISFSVSLGKPDLT